MSACMLAHAGPTAMADPRAWPLTGTLTADTDPKSVVHISVEVAMGWDRTNSISLSEEE